MSTAPQARYAYTACAPITAATAAGSAKIPEPMLRFMAVSASVPGPSTRRSWLSGVAAAGDGAREGGAVDMPGG